MSIAATTQRGPAARAVLIAVCVAQVLATCSETEHRPGSADWAERGETTENRTAAGADARAAPEPGGRAAPIQPQADLSASGVAQGDARRTETPAQIGLMPAESARPDPGLAADTGSATDAIARWGSSGRNLDARSPWRSLAHDGIHDATSKAAALLQQPGAAFRDLPRANSGNLVDWVAALDEGRIKPRGGANLEVRDSDVLLVDTKTMPHVVFPHRPHTQRLTCATCHDSLFEKRAGATGITMTDIARGRSCGLCHGKVAFPATECFRCHSGPRPR